MAKAFEGTGPTTLIAQSPSAIEGPGRGILLIGVAAVSQLINCDDVSWLMRCIRRDGHVCTAHIHELMSQKEQLQRYHHPTLAPSRLLMQPLIGSCPCGSIRLSLRIFQPYISPMHSRLGSQTASFSLHRSRIYIRRHRLLSVSMVKARDVRVVDISFVVIGK